MDQKLPVTFKIKYEPESDTEECQLIENVEKKETHVVKQEHNDLIFVGDNIMAGNQIVLGSRFCPNETKKNDPKGSIYQPKVIECTEDMKDTLENNPCYCRSCKLLFLTPSSLDYHNTVKHSVYIKYVSKNVATKATRKYFDESKRNINYQFKESKPVEDGATIELTEVYLHRNNDFSSKDTISRHSLCAKENNKSSHTLNTKEDKKFYKCFMCSYFFEHYKDLSEHLVINHEISSIGTPKLRIFKPNCEYCPGVFDELSVYNMHIEISHQDKYFTVVNEKTDNYKVNTTITKSDNSSKILLKIPKLISKSVLFQCSICEICYFKCSTAKNHAVNCILGLKHRSWKCYQCDLKFRNNVDRRIHQHQHSFNSLFNVLKVSKDCDMLNRVLWKCADCDKYFHEIRLNNHFKDCNKKNKRSNAFECKKCELNICSKSLSYHAKEHNKSANRDFITLDCIKSEMFLGLQNFCDESSLETSTSQKEPNLNVIKKSKTIYEKKRATKPFIKIETFFRCIKCDLCIQKSKSKHICNQVKRRMCVICGINMQYSSFPYHARKHRMQDIKIVLTPFNPDFVESQFRDPHETSPKKIYEKIDNPVNKRNDVIKNKESHLDDYEVSCMNSKEICHLEITSTSSLQSSGLEKDCHVNNTYVTQVNKLHPVSNKNDKIEVKKAYQHSSEHSNHTKRNEQINIGFPSNTKVIEHVILSDDDDMIDIDHVRSFSQKEMSKISQNEVANYFLYKCNKCDLCFNQRQPLLNHIFKLHLIKGFIKCKICNLQFERNEFDFHMSYHHETLNLSRDDFEIEVIN